MNSPLKQNPNHPIQPPFFSLSCTLSLLNKDVHGPTHPEYSRCGRKPLSDLGSTWKGSAVKREWSCKIEEKKTKQNKARSRIECALRQVRARRNSRGHTFDCGCFHTLKRANWFYRYLTAWIAFLMNTRTNSHRSHSEGHRKRVFFIKYDWVSTPATISYKLMAGVHTV